MPKSNTEQAKENAALKKELGEKENRLIEILKT
jgi:hypothetical protein